MPLGSPGRSSRTPLAPAPSLGGTARKEVESWIQSNCLAVVRGRKASALVARWARAVGLTEAEWQLLWMLSGIPQRNEGRPVDAVETLEFVADQSELAERLMASPAQISECVNRLQDAGLLLSHRPKADRRRQLWRISDGGRRRVEEAIALASGAPFASPDPAAPLPGGGSSDAA